MRRRRPEIDLLGRSQAPDSWVGELILIPLGLDLSEMTEKANEDADDDRGTASSERRPKRGLTWAFFDVVGPLDPGSDRLAIHLGTDPR